MESNMQANSLMSAAGAPVQGQAQSEMRKPKEDDLFTRTILTGARKAYYNPEQQGQVLQMIQSGASPGAGVALAAMSILQMVGETLAEQGKESPPELLFNPDGPVDFIVEDLAEIAAAEFGVDVAEIQAEADALVDEQIAGYAQGGGQAPPQGQPPVDPMAQSVPQGNAQPSLMSAAQMGAM